MRHIGQIIKEEREAISMTQTELANKVGYADKTVISKIERGVMDVKRDKIVAIAKALGCTPMHLMGCDERPEDTAEFMANVLLDPDVTDLIKKYMRLNEEQKNAVKVLVGALVDK